MNNRLLTAVGKLDNFLLSAVGKLDNSIVRNKTNFHIAQIQFWALNVEYILLAKWSTAEYSSGI